MDNRSSFFFIFIIYKNKLTTTGEIKIETATGMLISSYSNLKLKGELQVMGTTVPIKLTTGSSIKRIN